MSEETLEPWWPLNVWLEREGISKSGYQKLKKLGYGAEVLEIPGTYFRRVTQSGAIKFREQLAKLKVTERKKLEQHRAERQARATIAGQANAAQWARRRKRRKAKGA
jgi:hypothetical protein